MRVLFIASTALKSGGSLRSLADLTAYFMHERLVEPFVILPDYGDGEDLFRQSGVPYAVVKSYSSEWPLGQKKSFRQRLSHFRQRLENKKAIKTIYRLTRGSGFDLVHINTSISEIGYYVAKKLELPFVWHIREFVNEGLGLEFYNPKRVYSHMRQANCLIAISTMLVNRYEKLLNTSRITLIHNGFDPVRFYRERNYTKDGPIVVTMVGRVSKLKGHFDVIDALSLIPEAQIKLLFLGNEGEGLLDYASEKGVRDRIDFLGFKDDVRPYLWSSDVFISGHPWEAFGRAAVEAMMSGCCLVGVNNAGTKDLAIDKETGMLYPIGDIKALSGILYYLCHNREDLKRIAQAGQKRARELFSLERHAKKVLKVYELACQPDCER